MSYYSIHLPSTWTSPGKDYTLRAARPDKTRPAGKRLRPNIRVKLDQSDYPPGSTVWIEEYDKSSNAVFELTPRTKLNLLPKAKKLRTILLQRNCTEDVKRDFESIVFAARWIQHDYVDPHLVRIGRDLMVKVARESIDKTLLKHIIDTYQNELSPDDASIISNQILYLGLLARFAAAMRTAESSSLNFRHQSGENRCGNELQALLNEYSSLRTLGSVQALCLGLTELLQGRVAAAEYASNFENTAISSLVASANETGALNYGTVHPARKLPKQQPICYLKEDNSENSAATILYSADPWFFRRYGTRLLFYAQYFPEYLYHVHLVGAKNECQRTLAEFEDLQKLNSNFTNLHHVPKFEWSWSTVPDSVVQPTAYFASARFLVARQILELKKKPLWIQDVDLFPVGDSTNKLAALLESDVAAVKSWYLRGALPWKRVLAGNVFINMTPNARSFLKDTSDYLSEWLPSRHAWMIDQNALSYALEKSDSSLKFLDLATLNIPLQQTQLSSRIESK